MMMFVFANNHVHIWYLFQYVANYQWTSSQVTVTETEKQFHSTGFKMANNIIKK